MFGLLVAVVAAGHGVARDSDKLDSGWPPVLVLAVVIAVAAAVTGIVIMVRRTRAIIRGNGKARR